MIDLEALAASQMAKKADQREQNRRDFPLMASYLKLLERFNPRAIYAQENGKTIGKDPQE